MLMNKDGFMKDIVELDRGISQQDKWIEMDFGVIFFGEDIAATMWECISMEDRKFLVVGR